MIITSVTIAADFKSVHILLDAEAGHVVSALDAYLGSDYLTPTPINLDSLLSGQQLEDLTITVGQLGLEATDEIRGIITFSATNSMAEEAVMAAANLYYVNLCLANMIVLNNAANGFNEIETIYFLIKAIGIFLPANRIEESLNCYERIVAMCEKNPSYLVTEDITPGETGSGDWIINGTYVIN